jgi:hypothetical protein
LAAFLTAIVLTAASTASAQTFTITGGTASPKGTVSAAASTGMPVGRDFATEVIGDPWDFEQESDWNHMLSLDAYDSYKSGWVGTPTHDNGILKGVSNSTIPTVNLQFEGIVGGLNMAARNGIRFPLDGGKYRRLSFRVRRSVTPTDAGSDLMSAMWFTALSNVPTGVGSKWFVARGYNPHAQRFENQMPAAQQNSGWQVYKVDLDLSSGVLDSPSPSPRFAGTVLGLTVRFGNSQQLVNSTIELDWVRLTERGTATATLNFSGFGGPVTVTARHAETGDVLQVYPDNGTNATTFADGSSYTWDYGFLPPGTWTITSSGRNGTRTADLVIDAAPVIDVIDPDVTGGKDFATTVLGDAWDLANREDVTRHGRLYDIDPATFGAAGLTATTLGRGGQPGGDAFVALLDGSLNPNSISIPADEYYRLSFTLEYLSGKELPLPIALNDDWGAVFRVIWHKKENGTSYTSFSETKPVVMLDGGPMTFAMDLRTLTTTGPVEPAVEPWSPVLWTGPIGIFRIDVNEASGVDRPFRLSNVKLAADDEPGATGLFTVRWSVGDATFSRQVPNANGADATVTLYYDTDTNPAGRVLLASNVPASQGSYAWDVTSLSPGLYYVYATVTDAAGNTQSRFSTGPLRVRPGLMPTTDNDDDGMPDAWEVRYALAQPGADEDADAVSNLDEFKNGTDPRIANRWVLPEGSTGFFTERLAMLNPNPEDAAVDVRFLLEQGGPITRSYTVPGQSRLSVDVNSQVPAGAVSAVVESTSGGVVVERTMFWGDQWYGGHTGKAIQNSRTQWYLAEGDAGFFDTFILLANPNGTTATVAVDYLLEGGAPIRREYVVGGNARVTIDTKQVPGLTGKAFSTSVSSDQPINVERSMYFSNQGRFWAGGHEAAAVEAPATDWFVAEGRTGPFFDTYLLLANPQAQPVSATLRFLTPGGPPIEITRSLPPQSRTTVPLDLVPGLTDTDVSTSVSASAPIVVERAMYWPGNFADWTEAHASAGVTATGTRWAMAEGEFGGSRGFETYVLLANPTSNDASVAVTLLRSGGRDPLPMQTTVAANSRLTLSAGQLGLTPGEQFGIVIDSTNGVPVVAERAMYWNGGGVFWGGGTNETAVRLR